MISASASRVTRSSRGLRLAVATFAGVLAVATVLRAQDTPPAVPAESPPAAPADEAVPAEAAKSPPPDPGRPVGPTPSRFEPTEKVRADFDVAFPIDI